MADERQRTDDPRPSWLDGGAEAVAMAEEDAKFSTELSAEELHVWRSIGAITEEDADHCAAP